MRGREGETERETEKKETVNSIMLLIRREKKTHFSRTLSSLSVKNLGICMYIYIDSYQAEGVPLLIVLTHWICSSVGIVSR